MKKNNFLALSQIQYALNKSLFPRILVHITAIDAWKALEEAYQGSIKVKEVKLQTLK